MSDDAFSGVFYHHYSIDYYDEVCILKLLLLFKKEFDVHLWYVNIGSLSISCTSIIDNYPRTAAATRDADRTSSDRTVDRTPHIRSGPPESEVERFEMVQLKGILNEKLRKLMNSYSEDCKLKSRLSDIVTFTLNEPLEDMIQGMDGTQNH